MQTRTSCSVCRSNGGRTLQHCCVQPSHFAALGLLLFLEPWRYRMNVRIDMLPFLCACRAVAGTPPLEDRCSATVPHEQDARGHYFCHELRFGIPSLMLCKFSPQLQQRGRCTHCFHASASALSGCGCPHASWEEPEGRVLDDSPLNRTLCAPFLFAT